MRIMILNYIDMLDDNMDQEEVFDLVSARKNDNERFVVKDDIFGEM